MRQYYLNVHSMLRGVLLFMDENAALWSGNEDIEDLVGRLRLVEEAIGASRLRQQGHNPEPFTTAKDAAMDHVADLAYTLALRLKVYGKKTGNTVLAEAMDFSRSEMAAGPEEDVIDRCAIVASRAATHTGAPARYRITTGDVAALAAAIEAAKPKEAERDVVAAKRKSTTRSLPDLFVESRNILLDLDETIEAQVENEEFIDGYEAVRGVKNYGQRS